MPSREHLAELDPGVADADEWYCERQCCKSRVGAEGECIGSEVGVNSTSKNLERVAISRCNTSNFSSVTIFHASTISIVRISMIRLSHTFDEILI